MMQGSNPQFNQAGRMGGDTTVLITGENFPKEDGSTVTGWYGKEYVVPYPTGDVTVGSTGYDATCVITSDIKITCTAPCVHVGSENWDGSGPASAECRPPGVGGNHEWRLTFTKGATVTTLSSGDSLTTSFFPAFTFNAIFLKKDTGMPTTGGSDYNVEMRGIENRGLNSDVNNVIYALYERSRVKSPPSAASGIISKPQFAPCAITDVCSPSKTGASSSNTWIECTKTVVCTPAAGVGGDLAWKLYIGGVPCVSSMSEAKSNSALAAVEFSPNTDYDLPQVLSIDIVGSSSTLPTVGGDTVVLTGKDFGPLDVQNVVSATYRNDALSGLSRT